MRSKPANTKETGVREIIEDLEIVIGTPDKPGSLRATAGLMAVSTTSILDWKAGKYLPKHENLVESKRRIVAAYQAVNKLLAVITADNTDLVVAEANE